MATDPYLNRREQMFPRLTDAQIERVASHGRRRAAAVGEVLFEWGDKEVGLFLVLEGKLEIVRPENELEARITELGPGILVEDKGYSLALHYRLAPEHGPALRAAVAHICAHLPAGSVEILPGKLVVEVKPAGISKALAVSELMTSSLCGQSAYSPSTSVSTTSFSAPMATATAAAAVSALTL